MRKDLAQPLEHEASRYHLLAQDMVSKKFFIKEPPQDNEYGDDVPAWEHSFYLLPSFDCDPALESLPMRIVKELQNIGLVAESLRELHRITNVSYSFIDETLGTTHDLICLQVSCDINHEQWERGVRGKMVPADELLRDDRLSRYDQLALKKLEAEDAL